MGGIATTSIGDLRWEQRRAALLDALVPLAAVVAPGFSPIRAGAAGGVTLLDLSHQTRTLAYPKYALFRFSKPKARLPTTLIALGLPTAPPSTGI
ncbi:hypothetical protein [Mesorhizobium sp.]|uniref:hypothetical protein n=1 Tax=Mesorhizobium sp. TaxID=1871066 RepID=UPI0025D7DE2B|nr:hypothetical protein [Mesorhizobium sp.]